MGSQSEPPKPGLRRPARALVALVACVPSLLAASSAAGAPPAVTVTLQPDGPTTVALGESFGFTAVATNSTNQPVQVMVVFNVAPVGHPDQAVPASSWPATVPASGSTSTSATVSTGQWFVGTGSFRVLAVATGARGGTVDFVVAPPTVVVPSFQDVTSESGLVTSLPDDSCGFRTAGAAWGDVEGDGDLDLYVPSRSGTGQLWIADGQGGFTEEAAARGVQGEGGKGASAIFVDYDGDGDQDLYVSNMGPNRLFANDGTGHFTDVTSQAGVGDPHASSSSSWADFDGDGDLDVYVTNNVECHPGGDRTVIYDPDTLYRNNGDGTFTDVTDDIGVALTMGSGFQALWFDADGDGDQDLYLANDYVGPAPDGNRLFRNDGPGPNGTWLFTDVSAASGTDLQINSMGIAVGDTNGDELLDLAISNIAGNVLLSNDGDGTFTEVAHAAGAAVPYQRDGVKAITWGLGFVDLNLDTWPDLLVAAGSLKGTLDQPDEAFVNDGTGRFLNVTAAAGMTDPSIGRGMSFADFDGDGLVDVYVLNAGGEPRLYRNVTAVPGYHWLGVHLTGAGMDRDACGALVTVAVHGRSMLQEVLCGDSLGAGSDRTLRYGLKTATSARVTVRWPSGATTVARGVAADRVVQIAENG